MRPRNNKDTPPVGRSRVVTRSQSHASERRSLESPQNVASGRSRIVTRSQSRASERRSLESPLNVASTTSNPPFSPFKEPKGQGRGRSRVVTRSQSHASQRRPLESPQNVASTKSNPPFSPFKEPKGQGRGRSRVVTRAQSLASGRRSLESSQNVASTTSNPPFSPFKEPKGQGRGLSRIWTRSQSHASERRSLESPLNVASTTSNPPFSPFKEPKGQGRGRSSVVTRSQSRASERRSLESSQNVASTTSNPPFSPFKEPKGQGRLGRLGNKKTAMDSKKTPVQDQIAAGTRLPPARNQQSSIQGSDPYPDANNPYNIGGSPMAEVASSMQNRGDEYMDIPNNELFSVDDFWDPVPPRDSSFSGEREQPVQDQIAAERRLPPAQNQQSFPPSSNQGSYPYPDANSPYNIGGSPNAEVASSMQNSGNEYMDNIHNDRFSAADFWEFPPSPPRYPSFSGDWQEFPSGSATRTVSRAMTVPSMLHTDGSALRDEGWGAPRDTVGASDAWQPFQLRGLNYFPNPHQETDLAALPRGYIGTRPVCYDEPFSAENLGAQESRFPAEEVAPQIKGKVEEKKVSKETPTVTPEDVNDFLKSDLFLSDDSGSEGSDVTRKVVSDKVAEEEESDISDDSGKPGDSVDGDDEKDDSDGERKVAAKQKKEVEIRRVAENREEDSDGSGYSDDGERDEPVGDFGSFEREASPVLGRKRGAPSQLEEEDEDEEMDEDEEDEDEEEEEADEEQEEVDEDMPKIDEERRVTKNQEEDSDGSDYSDNGERSEPVGDFESFERGDSPILGRKRASSQLEEEYEDEEMDEEQEEEDEDEDEEEGDQDMEKEEVVEDMPEIDEEEEDSAEDRDEEVGEKIGGECEDEEEEQRKSASDEEEEEGNEDLDEDKEEVCLDPETERLTQVIAGKILEVEEPYEAPNVWYCVCTDEPNGVPVVNAEKLPEKVKPTLPQKSEAEKAYEKALAMLQETSDKLDAQRRRQRNEFVIPQKKQDFGKKKRNIAEMWEKAKEDAYLENKRLDEQRKKDADEFTQMATKWFLTQLLQEEYGLGKDRVNCANQKCSTPNALADVCELENGKIGIYYDCCFCPWKSEPKETKFTWAWGLKELEKQKEEEDKKFAGKKIGNQIFCGCRDAADPSPVVCMPIKSLDLTGIEQLDDDGSQG